MEYGIKKKQEIKNAIILHGWAEEWEYFDSKYPAASNSHWLPWLQKQLLMKKIHAVTPEMPQGYLPDYETWKREFRRYDINESTALIGHSCGGGFIVRWLSENPSVRVNKVVLVAPWIDPTDELKNDFFDFKIEEDFVSRTNGLTIFASTNDMAQVQKSVEILQKQLKGCKLVEFKNMGHFDLEAMGTEEFPELLEEILR